MDKFDKLTVSDSQAQKKVSFQEADPSEEFTRVNIVSRSDLPQQEVSEIKVSP